MQLMVKKDEGGQGHPTKESHLKRGQREGVRLDSCDHSILEPKMTHRGYREILKNDTKRIGEQIVGDIFGL